MTLTRVSFPQFAVFLSLIMLVEVAAAIAGYVFRDKVSREGGQSPTWASLNSGPKFPSHQGSS